METTSLGEKIHKTETWSPIQNLYGIPTEEQTTQLRKLGEWLEQTSQGVSQPIEHIPTHKTQEKYTLEHGDTPPLTHQGSYNPILHALVRTWDRWT